MRDSNSFNSLIDDLRINNKRFSAFLDRFIKSSIDILHKTPDLQEDLNGFECLYQICIPEANFNFWFSISNRKVIYREGINRKAKFYMTLTKDLVVKILKRETWGGEAYMKGLIKSNGDLTYGLRFLKLFQPLFNYVKKFYLNNKDFIKKLTI